MTQLVCRQLAQICAAVFMVLLPACAAQSAKPRAKPEPAVFSSSTVTAPPNPLADWHRPSAHAEMASSGV